MKTNVSIKSSKNSGQCSYPTAYRQAPTACFQPHTACRQPPIACRQPPTACRQPPTNCHQPHTACYQPPTPCRQPPTACRQPPTACRQPPTACRQPPTACRQLPEYRPKCLPAESSVSNTACKLLNDYTSCSSLQARCVTPVQVQCAQQSRRDGEIDEVKLMWLIKRQDTALARTPDQLGTKPPADPGKNITKKQLQALKQAHYPYHSVYLQKHSCLDDDNEARPVTRRNPSDMPPATKSPTKSSTVDSPDKNCEQYKDYAHFSNQHQQPSMCVFTDDKCVIGGPSLEDIGKEIIEDILDVQEGDNESCDGCDICIGTDIPEEPLFIECATPTIETLCCNCGKKKPGKTRTDIPKLSQCIECATPTIGTLCCNCQKNKPEKIRTDISKLSQSVECTTPTIETPLCICLKNKPAKTSVAEHEYLQFALRITEDIIKNDLYSNVEIKRVFNSHVEANRGRLDLGRMRLQIKELALELNLSLEDILCNDDENMSVTCYTEAYSDCCCGTRHCSPCSFETFPEVQQEVQEDLTDLDTSPSTTEKEEKEQQQTIKKQSDHHKTKGQKHPHPPRSHTSKRSRDHSGTKQEVAHRRKESVSPRRKHPSHHSRSRRKSPKAGLQKNDKKQESVDPAEADASSKSERKDNSPSPKQKSPNDPSSIGDQQSTNLQRIISKLSNTNVDPGSPAVKKTASVEIPESDVKSGLGDHPKVDVNHHTRRSRKHSRDRTRSADSAHSKKKHHRRKTKKGIATEAGAHHRRKSKSPSKSDTENENNKHTKAMPLSVAVDESQQQQKTEPKPSPSKQEAAVLNEKPEGKETQESPAKSSPVKCKNLNCPSNRFPYHLLFNFPCQKTDTVVQTEKITRSCLRRPVVSCQTPSEGTQTCTREVSHCSKKELPVQTDSSNFVILSGPVYIPKQAMKFSPPISPYQPPGLKTIQVAPAEEDSGKVDDGMQTTNLTPKKLKERNSYTQTKPDQFPCNQKKCTLKTCYALNAGQARDDLLLSDDYDAGIPESISRFFPTIATQTTSSDFLMIDKIMMAAQQLKETSRHRPAFRAPSAQPPSTSGYKIGEESRASRAPENIIEYPPEDPLALSIRSGFNPDESITVEQVETVPPIAANVVVEQETPKKSVPKKPRRKRKPVKIHEGSSTIRIGIPLGPENEMIGPEDDGDEINVDDHMTVEKGYTIEMDGRNSKSDGKTEEGDEEEEEDDEDYDEENDDNVGEDAFEMEGSISVFDYDDMSSIPIEPDSEKGQSCNNTMSDDGRDNEDVMVGDDDEDDDFMKKLDHKPKMSMTISMDQRIKRVIRESEIFRHPEEKQISWNGEAGIDLSENMASNVSIETQASSIIENVSVLLRNRSSMRDSTIMRGLGTIGEEDDDDPK